MLHPEENAQPSLGDMLSDPRPSILDSPMSQRLLAAARARPGLTLSEARDLLNTSWGSLYRHLVRLENAGLVRLEAAGRRRLLFPTGGVEAKVQPSVLQAAAFLRQPTSRLIATSIMEKPGRSVPEIAHALQLTPRVVYHHVQRLIMVGLITSSSQTRHRDLTPTAILPSALEMAQEPTRLRPSGLSL